MELNCRAANWRPGKNIEGLFLLLYNNKDD